MLQFLSNMYSYIFPSAPKDENTRPTKRAKIFENPLIDSSEEEEAEYEYNPADFESNDEEEEFDLDTEIDLDDVIITKSEIKQKIDNYIFKQRQICFGQHPTIDAIPSEIDETCWFDAEHVDGMLHYLVSQRNHLSNSVAIFPVFSKDVIYLQAQTYVYKLLKRDPRCEGLVPSNDPLPERSALEDDIEALEERDWEERRRNAQEKALRQKADEVLENNGISDEILFHWFLEAMSDSANNILKNRFRNCSQFIIPLRINNNHYTTAVVQAKGRTRNNKSVDIRYYDSKGEDLDDSYQTSLLTFFTEKGYDVNYECISENEQKYENNNCALFAALKSIDMANENVENDERLLQVADLNKEEYQQFFKAQRFNAVQVLAANGFNISADDSISPQQKKPKKRHKRTLSGKIKV